MIPNIQASLNPTSGLRDLSNTSRSGADAGTVGSVINNFALGGSKLTSEVGGSSEGKTLLWIGLAAAGVFLILKFRKS
ncbi:MAG: hypothetical protein E6Q97_28890 [Desulfurellales bacterium]|nr:MAG: hypothetical protein E6Q97_28890 [Desulfurellales bacterium]